MNGRLRFAVSALIAYAALLAVVLAAPGIAHAAAPPVFTCSQSDVGGKPYSSGGFTPPSTLPDNSAGWTCYYANYYDNGEFYKTIEVLWSLTLDSNSDYCGRTSTPSDGWTYIYSSSYQTLARYHAADAGADSVAQSLLGQSEAQQALRQLR